MDRLCAIADAHYRASPPAARALVYDFFKALDSDQDGRVSLHEFLALMKHQGHARLANPHFFRDLDRDGNGSLDFWEVLTLYYIVKSGRPLCECCGILVPGTFFSCVECFDSPMGSYSLCIYCYRSNKSGHNHGGRQQFLDTFTLLETKRRSSGNGRGRMDHFNQQNNWQQTRPTMGPPQPHMHNNGSHPQNWNTPERPDAIVPEARMEKWKTALMALEVGLGIGSISTTLCTIL